MIKIDLPWPPRDLSPNARVHWAALYRAKRQYKQIAQLVTLEALQGRKCYMTDGPIDVKMIFYPSSQRRLDQDNLIASLKSGLDGIAEALGVDDSRFNLARPIIGEVSKPPCVTVEIG